MHTLKIISNDKMNYGTVIFDILFTGINFMILI